MNLEHLKEEIRIIKGLPDSATTTKRDFERILMSEFIKHIVEEEGRINLIDIEKQAILIIKELGL